MNIKTLLLSVAVLACAWTPCRAQYQSEPVALRDCWWGGAFTAISPSQFGLEFGKQLSPLSSAWFDASWIYDSGFHVAELSYDWMVDVPNLLYGFKADREWSAGPVAGLGIGCAWNPSKPTFFAAARVGLRASYRLDDHFNMVADFRYSMMDDTYDGIIITRRYDGRLDFRFGLTYSFGFRGGRARPGFRNADPSRFDAIGSRTEALRQQAAYAREHPVEIVDTIDVRKSVQYVYIAYPSRGTSLGGYQKPNLSKVGQLWRSLPKARIYICNASKSDDWLFRTRAMLLSGKLMDGWKTPSDAIWIDASSDHVLNNLDPEVDNYIMLIVCNGE